MTAEQLSEPHFFASGETLPDCLPTKFEDAVLCNTVCMELDDSETDGWVLVDLKHLDADTIRKVQDMLHEEMKC